MKPLPSHTPSRLLGAITLLSVLMVVFSEAQTNVLDWRDAGWTNLATGGPSEFLSNTFDEGAGWDAAHRLTDVGGSGIDATLRISHQPRGWNIENRPALGPYFASPNGIDGDILRAWNSDANIPSGELAYYTLEFSQPVTISKFGLEGMRRDDAWQIQAVDWAGNLVEPNWPDANVAVETTAGDPLQNEPINLLRGPLTEAESSGRYDAASTSFITWNKNNVSERAASVVDYNGVVAKKMIFTMIEVDTTTGISTGTPSDSSIYLAGGFEFGSGLGGGGDPDPGSVTPLPQCFLVADDGQRLTTYNHDTQIETDIGDLGVGQIEAITFDPAAGILYGAGANQLYQISTATGAATAIGEWSPSSIPTPFGALDGISFTDVDGLARDVSSNIWYASARTGNGIEGGSPDVLFQFDPTTGRYIPGAFPGGHDYVRIEKPSPGLNLIDDLSIDIFTGKLYGIANGFGSFALETTIVEIDPNSGDTIDLGNVVYDPDDSGPAPAVNIGDAEGLTITLDRRILITTGKGGNYPQTLFELKGLGSGGTITATKLSDIGLNGLYLDYEAITCAVFVQPAQVGGTVFEDFDTDGNFGGSDAGIGAVQVQLKDGLTDAVIATKLTDTSGTYHFGGLPFGSYNIVIPDSNFVAGSPLQGRTATADPDGDNDNQASFIAPPLPLAGQDSVISFDGIDDYAVGHTNFNTTGAFTMSTWVYPNHQSQIGGIMATSSAEGIARHAISQALDRFVFQFENVADLLVSQTKISPGFWYHLAATYDGSSIRLYVNGILEAEKQTNQIASDTNRVWLGRSRSFIGQIYFGGKIDSTSCWETALTVNQIQSVAQLGVNGFEPGLSSYWDWDNSPHDDRANGYDYAQNSHNMELAGPSRINVSEFTSLDFGFTTGSKPDTFASWQTTFGTVLGSESGPQDNPDGDIHSNLLEYALCLHPGTGVYGPGGFLVEGTATDVDAVFWRRSGGHSDITYYFEGRNSLPVEDTELWKILLAIPGQGTPPDGVTVTDLGNGIEEVRITNLGSLAPLTPELGFVRMTVYLDDGSQTSAAYTQVFSWRETIFNGTETATYGNALTKIEVVSGSIDAISGTHVLEVTTAAGSHSLENILDLKNKDYYLEIISGDNEGHRYDIAGAAGDTLTIATDSDTTVGPPFNTVDTTKALASDLVGDSFILREHYTLDDYFPASGFTPTSTYNEKADQVYFFTSTGWQIYWLYEDDSAGDRWVFNGDPAFTDVGNTVIAPGEGLFIRSSNETTILAVGPVRKNAFCRPLPSGYSLVGPGFPKDQSPAERAMSPAAFDGDPSVELADQICAWDSTSAIFNCYFLLENAEAETPRWIHTEDTFLRPADFDSSIFRADRAQFYYRANTNSTGYSMPLSWCIGLVGE